jgi:hypothetical protein
MDFLTGGTVAVLRCCTSGLREPVPAAYDRVGRVTYRYNASVWGYRREDLEYTARQEAKEFFGTSEFSFLGAEVTGRIPEGGSWEYVGTYSYELRGPIADDGVGEGEFETVAGQSPEGT